MSINKQHREIEFYGSDQNVKPFNGNFLGVFDFAFFRSFLTRFYRECDKNDVSLRFKYIYSKR